MIIKELIANVNAFIRNKDFDELIKFLNRSDVNIGNVENNFNYYIHDINMDNVFKYAERVNGTWQLKEIKEEKEINQYSCFCKNCVPSPACELEKVKQENKFLIFAIQCANNALGARRAGKNTFIQLANELVKVQQENERIIKQNRALQRELRRVNSRVQKKALEKIIKHRMSKGYIVRDYFDLKEMARMALKYEDSIK